MKELILEAVEKNKDEYIELLERLIRAESYNPPGNEANVAKVIKAYLEDNGIKCDLFEFGENRANLIAYLNDDLDTKNLVYNGHMDVVPPGEKWKFEPLDPVIKRRRLNGRGATDMKGGLAAMIASMVILKKVGVEYEGNLILHAVADEETGGIYGTKSVLEEMSDVRCDFVVVGEPTGLKPLPKAIIVGEKGHVKIRTYGVSAHSSAPFMGRNAIYMMSDIIQNLDELEGIIPSVEPPLSLDKLKDLLRDALPNEEHFNKVYDGSEKLQGVIKSLTQFTKSLNIISGGVKDNMVPSGCESIMDFRLLPGQDPLEIVNGLKEIVKRTGYELGKEADVELLHSSGASICGGWRESEELKGFFNIVEDVYGRKPFYFLFPAGADASYYRNTGYCEKTILFGPGNASTAHAVDEHIELSDYLNAIKVYALFANDFLKK